VDGEHRKKTTAQTAMHAHIPADSPVIHMVMAKGKSAELRWTNLQLPLYAVAVRQHMEILPTPCYITLGATAADVKLNEWPDFGESDLTAAKECTAWIVERIAAGVFWPPAEKPKYDDFAALAAGRPLEEMCGPPA
jgi:hypothetical protein